MRIIQRGEVHELQLDHADADHRFRLARAFLSEAADAGAWRVFVGLPEDWQLFAKALQGIEGGTLLAATGEGLEPLVRHYATHEVELRGGRFEKRYCTCGLELITPQQLATGRCEDHAMIHPDKPWPRPPAKVRTHGPRDLTAEIRA